MKLSARLFALPILALGLFLAGCDSGGEDGNGLEGTYDLVRIGDEEIPALQEEYSAEQCPEPENTALDLIESGSLTLNEDATFELEETVTSECEESGEVFSTDAFRTTGTYTTTENTIRLISDSSDDEFSDVEDSIDDNRVIIEFAGDDPRVYEK